MKGVNALALELAKLSPLERQESMKIGAGKLSERGFLFFRWRDRYGQHCRLSKSSLAGEDCIWLGTSEDSMHLTQQQAAELAPLLAHFADTGELPE